MEWVIRLAGKAQYRFCAMEPSRILIRPRQDMLATKIPDATPGVIDRYALNDEQALLAIIRYNRLIDTFLGVTCYSLQSHLRTQLEDIGQVETDEIYIGIDRRGSHYIIPIQAKGKGDKLGIVQVEQDFALCREKFPNLVCRPVAAQFIRERKPRQHKEPEDPAQKRFHYRIALFGFEQTAEDVGVSAEKHYRLVPQQELTDQELETYRQRPVQD